jgi:microcystin degradation protein MlrC
LRIAAACLWQETNSFNALPTTMEDFEAFGLYRGEEMLVALEGDNEVGGVISAARESPATIELVPIIRAWGAIGGPLSRETYRALRAEIVTGLSRAGDVDGVVLLLHGACAAQGTDDVDGQIIGAVRTTVGPRVPVVASLDHHANVTRLMTEAADALIGHRSEPHDPRETAELAMNLLISIIEGSAEPVMAWRKIPMLLHQEQFLTAAGPMRTLFDRAREMETLAGVLSVSVFPMQPWLDVDEAGWATLVVADRDQGLADELAGELADLAWSLRHDFARIESLQPAEAVDRAARASTLGIVCDMGDAVFAGASGDSTFLLDEILGRPEPPSALVPMWDAEAASAAASAGAGTTISIEVGGKHTRGFSSPRRLEASVVEVARDRIELDGSVYGLKSIDQGQTALLDAGPVKLLVSEKRGLAGSHPVVYRRFGVEPREFELAVLKTAANVHGYAGLAPEVFRADTPGLSQSRLDLFEWRRVPRPIFGLDSGVRWAGRGAAP